MLTFLKRLFSKPNTIAENQNNTSFNKEIPKIQRAEVDQLIERFYTARPEERELLSNSIDDDTAWSLVLESKNFAVEAVKQNNYDLIRKGLILHSIENSRYDWRDNLVRLSLLYNSAKKLNQNPDTLFEEIADISQSSMKELLIGYTKREDKSIKAMGYIETNDPEFDYIKAF